MAADLSSGASLPLESGRRPAAYDKSTEPGPRRRSRWVLPIAAGAGFLGGLDTTAVNLALPDIQRELGASLTELQWVVNAFALVSAALLVTAGNLSDRFDVRRVFVAGVMAFGAASAACGVASSALVLDLTRAAQGAASAVVTASGLALLARTYPSAQRGRALGLYAAIGALSFVVGPLAGGLLTDTLGWRAVFVANVPVAGLIALAASAVLPRLADRVSSRGSARFDYAGVVTLTLGLAAVLYAAMQLDQVGWTADVLIAGGLGVAGLLTFVAVERRSADGIVDFGLFRSRTFTGATAAIALGAAAYFGMLVYVSLFLQATQGYGALETGLIYLPTILPYMIISPLAGRLLERLPGPLVPTAGIVLVAVGMLLLLGVEQDAGLLAVTPGLAVAGIGSGLAVTPLMQLALDQVPSTRTGMAAGVLQTSRPLGVTLGVTSLGLVVPEHLDATAFHAVAMVAAAIAALGAIVAAGTIRSTAEATQDREGSAHV